MSDGGMDPMYLSHVKLLASDLLSLQNPIRRGSPETFWRKGRPVRKVEILGVVVSRERKDKFLKFQVDDGTGCVPCILWLNHNNTKFYLNVKKPQLECIAAMAVAQSEDVHLGKLVRVHGRLTVYNNLLQVTVNSVVVERDPNAEVLHWMDCIRLAVRCYDLPAPLNPKT